MTWGLWPRDAVVGCCEVVFLNAHSLRLSLLRVPFSTLDFIFKNIILSLPPRDSVLWNFHLRFRTIFTHPPAAPNPLWNFVNLQGLTMKAAEAMVQP